MEKQIQMQTKQMLGEEVPQDMMQNIQKLTEIVTADPAAAQYLQCQMRFSIMMQDVYNILGETVNL